MPSIEDLKRMPTTGEAIELGVGAPVQDENPVVNNVRPNNNGMRVNIGANNKQPIVKRPKTVIGMQSPVMPASQPNERVELDLSSLPKSPLEQADEAAAKESPMEDISNMVDEYLDDKEEELKEAYATVAQNIQEAKEEAELDDEDSLDAVLDDDDDFTLDAISGGNSDNEDNEPKKVTKVASDSSILDDLNEEDDEDLDDVDDSDEDLISTTVVESNVEDNDSDIEDDPENEMAEEAEANSRDAYLKKLKDLATQKLKPAAKALNLKSFTIMRKPTTNINFLKQSAINVAKWVLPNQESIVLMREYLGIELEELRRVSEDSTSPTALTRKFRSIYDHIESPKPGTFEAWLKATPYSDIDHYFFAVFIASYQGTNFIPYDCRNQDCKNTFLTDDMKIMSMVKFKDKESEAKFKKIYKEEQSSSTKEGIYVSEIVQISDRIAIAFKEPSVYNVIENNSIDGAFRRKYTNIINMIPYIDSIYMIDQNTSQLIPVGYKMYEGNATKTFKSKIQKYNEVFKSLTNDEFTLIQSYVSTAITRESFISYQYPEVECPECHKTIPASPIDAESAVFTRYQLGALVNTTLN